MIFSIDQSHSLTCLVRPSAPNGQYLNERDSNLHLIIPAVESAWNICKTTDASTDITPSATGSLHSRFHLRR